MIILSKEVLGMEDFFTFKRCLRQAREASGKSVERCASQAKVSYFTWTNWENLNSLTLPSDNRVARISKVCKASKEELSLALQISKQSRRRDVQSRKPSRKRIDHNYQDLFPGRSTIQKVQDKPETGYVHYARRL